MWLARIVSILDYVQQWSRRAVFLSHCLKQYGGRFCDLAILRMRKPLIRVARFWVDPGDDLLTCPTQFEGLFFSVRASHARRETDVFKAAGFSSWHAVKTAESAGLP